MTTCYREQKLFLSDRTFSPHTHTLFVCVCGMWDFYIVSVSRSNHSTPVYAEGTHASGYRILLHHSRHYQQLRRASEKGCVKYKQKSPFFFLKSFNVHFLSASSEGVASFEILLIENAGQEIEREEIKKKRNVMKRWKPRRDQDGRSHGEKNLPLLHSTAGIVRC